ncbi:serine/threonine-protein kinase [Calothrix rhizosoleniae]|uniref:serine/threonine-protein kinase n=1 Tax=Calothrix rhizosoleniae TaxID=888997 RepID=UPI000B49C09B|nr:serine/threonine-protein kinase [Calothrix rhizosoleniae]
MPVYCSKHHENHGNNRFCTQCGELLPIAPQEIIADRYRIVRMLGQGGFGRSYLVEDIHKSQQQCVLKEFAPQVEKKLELQKARELFEREAHVLKRLNHPQIPSFHSSLEVSLANKELFLLVQDYVEGDNYLQLLEKRQHQGETFTEDELVKLLQQILPVLSYIHSQKVVHRDISPDNLIWRLTDNLPVLIDFGGVKQLPASKGFWFTQLSGNRTLLGKKGYAPEEQLRQGQAFPSSDLYSLAVTVLVLLTGKEPQKLYDSYHGNWRWGEEIKVNSNLEGVLKKMLAYKPSDRYQTADQALKDLRSPSKVKTIPPYITKIKTMVMAPGKQKIQNTVSKFNNQTQAIAQSISMPLWLRPFAISLVGTSVVVLSLVGSWALVNAVVRSVASISLPQVSLPKLPGGAHKEGSQIKKILNRRQKLGIPEGFFNRTVNAVFYTKNTQIKGRSLTSNSEDAVLRREWYQMAEELLQKLEQAKLSRNARQNLGNYSGKDYDKWKQQANSKQLGKYTIDRLNQETNQKFYRLFPELSRQKLAQQNFGQIWYAIASDIVAKAR